MRHDGELELAVKHADQPELADSLVPLRLPDSQLLAHDESSVDVDGI
ncbi:hypothetical protein [Paraburkholderia tuberum]|nr:hypothetical protein [Paraburkholderia tuberum]